MNSFYIYIYFDPSRNMEPFYVGKGKGNRDKRHLGRKDNLPFPNRIKSMSKQGISPIIERHEGLTEDEAFNLEIELIKMLGRKDLGLGPLLNLTDGGEGQTGIVWTEERRKKISNAHTGKIHTDEYKKKMSDALKGKKQTKEHIEKRAQFNKHNKYGKGYKFTEEQKQKVRDASARMPTVTCPHCGLIGRGGAMTRYHFSNCKNKQK